MKYFAYGSNMLEQRLRANNRVPDAAPLGTASIRGYQLRFHKTSVDRSGKCNLFSTACNDDIVYGVVFEVPESQRKALDDAEGPGYRPESIGVKLLDGEQICVLAYVADSDFIDDSRMPYDWYHRLVLAGAEQHTLPDGYIECLQAVRTTEDPCLNRETKREAEDALQAYYAT